MSYAMVEIDVQQPLPTLVVPPQDTGLAVILRYRDRPIGFVMQALTAKRALSPTDLAQLIEPEIDTQLLQEDRRAEWAPPLRPTGFPSLTIALCTQDRPEMLARCLRSLHALPAATLGLPAAREILIVDNAPSDTRTRELVASLPEVRYICEPKPGLDFARNRALEEATGELLVFLDDDVTVDRGWLAGLMEAWVENPDAAAFTGLVLPYELATEAQIMFEQRGGFRTHLDDAFQKKRYGPSLPANPLYPCEAARFGVGANMTFQRDILRKLGGFDEALDTGARLPGGGDLDMFYRVIRAGYPLVYEPKYLVFHQHRRDLATLRRQYWGWSLGFTAFLAKSYHTDPTQRPKLRWLVGGWFKYQLQQLQQSLRGRHALPPTLVVAEFCGGVMGLLGGYSRSLKRIEHLRRQFNHSVETDPVTMVNGTR